MTPKFNIPRYQLYWVYDGDKQNAELIADTQDESEIDIVLKTIKRLSSYDVQGVVLRNGHFQLYKESGWERLNLDNKKTYC